jgi:hypothetical protein
MAVTGRKLAEVVDQGIAGLFPGYFALVMATGIFSICWFVQTVSPYFWSLATFTLPRSLRWRGQTILAGC